MKKTFVFLVLACCAFLLFQAFVLKPSTENSIPDDVEKVLKSSCYDCHSNDASSKKGKLALNFDKWENYKITKKISKLEDISELVENGKMPPGKYLKSKPERALSDDSKKLIFVWTAEESAKLMEGD